MSGTTGPITEAGKDVSKQNAVKHGLYLHFADFFPCNLCLNRGSCKDFLPGGTCKIDRESFQEMLKRELNVIEIMESLICYNIIRLNRATEQLHKEPHHRELSRISSELRQALQSLFVMHGRLIEHGGKDASVRVLPKKSEL